MRSLRTAPSLRRSLFGRDVEADKLAAAALTVATLLRIGMCFEVGATVFIQSATALAAQEPLCRRVGAVHCVRLGKSQTEHIESASPPRADMKRTCRIGRFVPLADSDVFNAKAEPCRNETLP